MRKLEPKMLRFCQEYVIDLNGSQAAIRAGYSKHSSKERASKLLTLPNVIAEVKRLQEAILKRNHISADAVIAELAKIGFHNVQDFISKGNEVRDLTTIPREHAASVSSIRVTERKIGTGKTAVKETTTAFKLHDKRAALETLGKHLGIFEKDNDQRNKKVTIRVTTKKNGS